MEPRTSAPSVAFGHAMLAHWPLDPDVLYLNHGTVGVVPKRVLAAQARVRDEIERQPARYLLRELADTGEVPRPRSPRMRIAAAPVAAFVGVAGDELLFVDNATTGCNAVLRSFDLAPGDEVIVNDQGYGAVTNAARYAALRAGAQVRVVTLPFPGTREGAVADAYQAAFTPRTRLAVVDHVTSPMGLVLPVVEIAARARARGIATLVDGAHAPGMLPLDLPSLGADFYTGNLHKWAMSARPLGLLWAAPSRRAGLHPVVISWGYERGPTAEFDLLGTRDPSAAIAAPEALAFMEDLGVEAMRAWNHRVAWDAARMLTSHWGTAIPAPESMFGSMVAVPLPERFGTTEEAAQRLKDALLFEERIEAQVLARGGRTWIRLAAQVYNEPSDFERLRDAVDRRG
jgi:isopenicillin-N epimerase